MSFILDALKKADAERQLGAVPDLHAQPVPVSESAAELSGWRRRIGWAALLAITLAIAAGAAIWHERSEEPEPAAASMARAPANVSPGSADTPSKPPQTASTKKADAIQIAPAQELPVPPPLPQVAQRPAKPAPMKPPPQQTASEDTTRTQTAAGPIGKTTADRLPTLLELPESFRRSLPPLAVGGSMYSANPANRMVLINKRLLREGEEVAPGLAIEKLMPNGAAMRYNGQAFQLPY